MAVKVVINGDYGGFSISREAAEFMAQRGNKRAAAEIAQAESRGRWYGYGFADGFDGGYERTNPDLVAAVELLGNEANGSHASLKVVEIPDGISWEIEEYDGSEHIAETHRTWS